jgi:hypothetical protein
MPQPMPDPDGGPARWFFLLGCGCAAQSTSQTGRTEGDTVNCPGHGDQAVIRLETSEEVDARY